MPATQAVEAPPDDDDDDKSNHCYFVDYGDIFPEPSTSNSLCPPQLDDFHHGIYSWSYTPAAVDKKVTEHDMHHRHDKDGCGGHLHGSTTTNPDQQSRIMLFSGTEIVVDPDGVELASRHGMVISLLGAVVMRMITTVAALSLTPTEFPSVLRAMVAVAVTPDLLAKPG